MASDNNCSEEAITEQEKVRIVSDFILNSPPGEFREVVNDVRILLANDSLLKEHGSNLFSKYAKEQLTPVILPISQSEISTSNHSNNSSNETNTTHHSSSAGASGDASKNVTSLVTHFNELGGNKFYDPRIKKSFKYDYLREEASDLTEWTPNDSSIESWRCALDDAWTSYAKSHYTNGNSMVFATIKNGLITLTACIEGHQFQPKNYWNGRWRSVWTSTFNPSSGGEAELKGTIRVHVHYYEDGNVQLITNKDITLPLSVSNETSTVKEFISSVKTAENEYQSAISENYTTMSDTTFKALRRPLPLTRAKIEWSKILTYRIGNELNKIQPC